MAQRRILGYWFNRDEQSQSTKSWWKTMVSILAAGLLWLEWYSMVTTEDPEARMGRMITCVVLAGVALGCAVLAWTRAQGIGRKASVGAMLLALTSILIMWLWTPILLSRHDPNRCLRNLSLIGAALHSYANAYGDCLPARLEDLVIAGSMNPEHLICPKSSDIPASPRRGLVQEYAQPGHNSLVYVGGGHHLAHFAPGDVVAYERLGNHGGPITWTYVLFADGNVKTLHVTELANRLPPKSSPSTTSSKVLRAEENK